MNYTFTTGVYYIDATNGMDILYPPMSKEKNTPASVIYICTGEKCKKRGSKEIAKLLRKYADSHNFNGVGIIRTHCTDNCKHGPVVCLQPQNTWHFHVDEHQAIALLESITEKE